MWRGARGLRKRHVGFMSGWLVGDLGGCGRDRGVDGFAGKVESVLDGISEMFLRRESAHFRVAVGSAGEGVGRPVVGVPRFELVGQDGGVHCEDASEGREGSGQPCGGVGGGRLGARSAAPARNHGDAEG